MLELFPYQHDAIAALRTAWLSGQRRAILCMLMAAGKTLCALELMRLCSEKGMRSLFLCDRRMLADQAVERARQQGLDAGIIMAGRGHDLPAPCQFASKQTLDRWTKRELIDMPAFQLGIIDECHRGLDHQRSLFERFPKAFWIGLTATPCNGKGNGLGAYYQTLIQPITPSALRAMGRIVPVRAFAPHIPDMKGVKTGKDGDYSPKSLAQRMTRENLIGDVCGWWKRLGEDRPSVYFGCDVAHAIAIRDDFRSGGVPAEMICDETPDDERDDIRRRLENGTDKVVVNCDVLAEGVDWPFVSLIGLVRPTKRLRRFLQNVGRGLRAHPGKVDMILIDHAGCVLFHGFPDVDRDWPLSEHDNIDAKSKPREPGDPTPMTCSQCTAVFSGTRTCPECGHAHVWLKQPKDYAQKNGTLIEVSAGDLAPDESALLMNRYWATCIATAIKRRKHAGMAAGMFSGKFGKPPWQAGVKPLPEGHGDWKLRADAVFPGFVRKKAQ